MRLIELNHGKTAIVDDRDYERLSKHKWYAQCSKGKWYARRGERIGNYVKNISMSHDIVLVGKRLLTIKHLNGNTLDYRRENLYAPALINKKLRYKYGTRDKTQMKTAILSIMERMAIDIEYGLHITNWKEKSEYNTVLIPEQPVDFSLNEMTCHCGQVFYTDKEIPNHNCK